jgi:hypothetical protein
MISGREPEELTAGSGRIPGRFASCKKFGNMIR